MLSDLAVSTLNHIYPTSRISFSPLCKNIKLLKREKLDELVFFFSNYSSKVCLTIDEERFDFNSIENLGMWSKSDELSAQLSSCSGRVKSKFVTNSGCPFKSVVIASDDNGSTRLCVDLDPSPEGRFGQIFLARQSGLSFISDSLSIAIVDYVGFPVQKLSFFREPHSQAISKTYFDLIMQGKEILFLSEKGLNFIVRKNFSTEIFDELELRGTEFVSYFEALPIFIEIASLKNVSAAVVSNTSTNDYYFIDKKFTGNYVSVFIFYFLCWNFTNEDEIDFAEFRKLLARVKFPLGIINSGVEKGSIMERYRAKFYCSIDENEWGKVFLNKCRKFPRSSLLEKVWWSALRLGRA